MIFLHPPLVTTTSALAGGTLEDEIHMSWCQLGRNNSVFALVRVGKEQDVSIHVLCQKRPAGPVLPGCSGTELPEAALSALVS